MRVFWGLLCRLELRKFIIIGYIAAAFAVASTTSTGAHSDLCGLKGRPTSLYPRNSRKTIGAYIHIYT
jgi:hypothetical protein